MVSSVAVVTTAGTERTAPNSLPRCISGVSIDINVAYNIPGLGSACIDDDTSIAIDLIKVHSESVVDGILVHSCTDLFLYDITDVAYE